MFCEESLGKNPVLYVHLTHEDVDRFRNGSVQSSYTFLRDSKRAMYEFEPRKQRQKTMTTDLKTNYDAGTCTSDVENKTRIVVNRTSKMRQTTCDWIKRILNEANT